MLRRIVNAIEILAALGAVVFVVMLFANEPGSGSAAASSPGARVFSANCATCHGAQGQGGTGPQLAGRVAKKYPNVADEIAVVTNGISDGGMPAWRGRLTAEQIKQVVDYTRTGLSG